MPLAPAKSLSRAQRDLSAHDFALAHKGRLAQLLASCVEDLAEEITNLKLALHEAGYWLAAQGVIATWRRLERRWPALRGQLEKMAAVLESDDLLLARRKRLERRVARLRKLG